MKQPVLWYKNMKIIITDVNQIWTPYLPALEPFADSVIVVCLNGEKVAYKYQCIVSPYKANWLGIIPYGMDSVKFHALRSVEDQLINEIGDHEDIVFLTDMEPEGLYPFLAVKDKNVRNPIHLLSITPWGFESRRRKKAIKAMLSDLSSLTSVLLFEGDYFLWNVEKNTTRPELIHDTQMRCGDMLPGILDQIKERKWDKAFFDTRSMQYVPLKEGEEVTYEYIEKMLNGIFDVTISCTEPGLVPKTIDYPATDKETLDEVEAIVPRIDGKRICNYLRSLRLKLAEANQIPFESRECPSVGPCAGTCWKCDLESEYLRKEMGKIKPEKRVYPYEKLTSWEVF